MHFLAINSFIFLSYYLLTSTFSGTCVSARVVCAGTFFCAQVILTQLILGLLGTLYLPVLIALNLFISAFVITYTIFSYIRKRDKLDSFLRQEIRIIRAGFSSILAWENIALIVLGVFASLWIFSASHFFPHRGIDDIVYHLPPLYEYIITHNIQLLPLDLRNHFAYPFNAEFLFMWQAIFFHSQRYVDFVQYVVAVFGVAVIYALARALQQPTRGSFFVAMLFLFSPVVLMQAGSNYIDIITAVFFLTSLYFCMRFYREGELFYLYCAGVSIGLMVGMKYSMPVLAVGLQFFILPRIFRIRKYHAFFYVLLICIFGGFWYIRNYIVLGNAFYPMDLSRRSMGLFVDQGSANIATIFSSLFKKAHLLYCRDTGLGSFHGGYGLVFWGIAFPAWLYMLGLSIKKFIERKSSLFLLWLQGAIGFLLLFLAPLEEFHLSTRFSIFIVAIGLLALGELLRALKEYTKLSFVLKAACIVFSICAVGLLSVSVYPAYRVDAAIGDMLNGKRPSEYKYLLYGAWIVPPMRYIAEPLDYITRDGHEGLDCYMASIGESFCVANLYGSNLQNRVWNFEDDLSKEPDVCVFQFIGAGKMQYIGRKITLSDVVGNDDYLLIVQSPWTFTFIKEDALRQDNREVLLCSYYEETFPLILESVNEIKKILREGIPIVVSSFVGHGLRYLELNGQIDNTVCWVPPGFEGKAAEMKSWDTVYTIGKPLTGFSSEGISRVRVLDKEEIVYMNKR